MAYNTNPPEIQTRIIYHFVDFKENCFCMPLFKSFPILISCSTSQKHVGTRKHFVIFAPKTLQFLRCLLWKCQLCEWMKIQNCCESQTRMCVLHASFIWLYFILNACHNSAHLSAHHTIIWLGSIGWALLIG